MPLPSIDDLVHKIESVDVDGDDEPFEFPLGEPHPVEKYEQALMDDELEWDFDYISAVEAAIAYQHGKVWQKDPVVKNRNDANIIMPTYDFVTLDSGDALDGYELDSLSTRVFPRALKPVAKSRNYSPSQKVMRLVFALAGAQHFSARHYNVDLMELDVQLPDNEEVYIHHPSQHEEERFVSDNEVLVHRLIKPIHGIKSAQRLWSNHFRQFFVEKMKFKESKAAKGVYVFAPKEKTKVIAMVNDGDIVLLGEYDEMDKVGKELENEYPTQDFGTPRKFMGTTIDYDNETGRTTLDRMRQIHSLQKKYHLKYDPSIETALPVDFDDQWRRIKGVQTLRGEEKAKKTAQFQQLIGELMSISRSVRFDIAYVVTKLANLGQYANDFLIANAMRVLQYVSNTIEFDLTLAPNESTNDVFQGQISTTFDDNDRHKATIGIVVLKHGLISWQSEPIEDPELTPIEAEIQAQALIVTELQYLNMVNHFLLTGGEYDRTKHKKAEDIILSNGPNLHAYARR